MPRWSDLQVTEITTAEIDTWMLGLQDEKGLATSTVNKILQNLRTLLDGAMGQGMIRFNPAKDTGASAGGNRRSTGVQRRADRSLGSLSRSNRRTCRGGTE